MPSYRDGHQVYCDCCPVRPGRRRRVSSDSTIVIGDLGVIFDDASIEFDDIGVLELKGKYTVHKEIDNNADLGAKFV